MVRVPYQRPGEDCLSYNDAVEEALCFGWIDGRAGTLDDKHHIRRFTPRRKGSGYSQPNIERLIWLDRHRMIHPKVRKSVEEIISAPFVFPEDILDAIRQDKAAWENYQKFAEPYKRIRVPPILTPRENAPRSLGNASRISYPQDEREQADCRLRRH